MDPLPIRLVQAASAAPYAAWQAVGLLEGSALPRTRKTPSRLSLQ